LNGERHDYAARSFRVLVEFGWRDDRTAVRNQLRTALRLANNAICLAEQWSADCWRLTLARHNVIYVSPLRYALSEWKHENGLPSTRI
jgi:hypothetical protein